MLHKHTKKQTYCLHFEHLTCYCILVGTVSHFFTQTEIMVLFISTYLIVVAISAGGKYDPPHMLEIEFGSRTRAS